VTSAAGRVASAPAPPRRVWVLACLACAMAFAFLLAGAPAALAAEDEPDPGGLLENEDVVPGDDVGPHPTGRYIIATEYNRGSGLGRLDPDNFVPALWGSLTEFFFMLNRWVVHVGLWLTEEPFTFDLVRRLTAPAVTLSRRMEATFIGPLRLNDFALFLAIAWSGYHLFRRRFGLGLGELAVSLLVAVFGAMLVANPAWLMRSLVPQAIGLSTEVIVLATGDTAGAAATTEDGEPNYDRAVRPLTRGLHKALIEQPYDLIAWGALLEGECATKRDEILSNEDMNPGSEEARNHMRGGASGTARDLIPRRVPRAIRDRIADQLPSGPCVAHAEFHGLYTADRVGMAAITFFVTLLVVVMLGLVAIGVVAAQIIVAAHLVLVPLLVAVGTVPGTGRQLLLKGGSNVLQALAVIVALSWLLAMLLVVITTILEFEQEASLIGSYFMLLVAVAMIFRARKRLVTSVQMMSVRVAERLQTRDAHGRPTGVASRGGPVMGLEGTYVAQRTWRPAATSREEYYRTVRREVEDLLE
jgi:hypothetical protein